MLFDIFKKRIANEIGFVFIGQSIRAVLNLLLVVFLSRNLNISDFGKISFFIVILHFTSSLIELGLSPSIVKIASNYIELKRINDSYSIFKLGLLIRLCINGFAILLSYPISSLIAIHVYHEIELIPVLRLAIVAGSIFNFGNIIISILRTLRKFVFVAILQPLIVVSNVIIIFFLFNFNLREVNYVFWTFILVPIIIYFGFIFSIPFKKIIKAEYRIKIVISNLINITKWMFFVRLIEGIANRIDVLMIRYYLSDAQVGLYYAAYKILAIFFVVSSSISVVLLPYISIWYSNNPKSLKRVALKIINYSSFAAFPIFVLFFINSDLIISIIYNNEFSYSAEVLKYILPTGLFAILMSATGHLIMNYINVKFLGLVSILAFISNVILNLIFIPKYGILGAAVATSASYFLMCLFYWTKIYFHIKEKVKFVDLSLPIKISFASVTMLLIASLLNVQNNITSILTMSFLCILVYVSLYLINIKKLSGIKLS